MQMHLTLFFPRVNGAGTGPGNDKVRIKQMFTLVPDMKPGMWKRKQKRENSTASTLEGRMEEEKKLVLLSFGEERVGGA